MGVDMSAVNELVVREYFELLGYLVSQPRKHMVPGRQKKADEEIDLIILNPTVAEHHVPEHLVWTTPDLRTVARAVVAVRGWHTGRFYASTFEQEPDILRFVESGPLRFAAKLLGSPPSMARILCIPELAASGELKDKSIRFLKEKGIDGVISFPTMLAELTRSVDKNKNYEKSDLLQIIRLLKNYELLREPQMDLFARGRRAHPRKRPAAAAEAAPSATPAE
jgi:hypothetical protein